MTNIAGLIFWGFSFEERELPWEEEEWQDYYACAIGLAVPNSSFSIDPKAHHAYWERKEQAIEKGGCEIEWSGDAEWVDRYPFVHISESVVYAAAPQLEPVNPRELKIKPAWKTQLQKFCEDMQIPFGQPGWFLTSICG